MIRLACLAALALLIFFVIEAAAVLHRFHCPLCGSWRWWRNHPAIFVCRGCGICRDPATGRLWRHTETA